MLAFKGGNTGFDMLANWIFVGKELPSKGFTNNYYGWRFVLIVLSEIPTFQERDPHCSKVGGSNRKKVGARQIAFSHRATRRLERNTEPVAAKRQRNDRARRLDSWQSPQPSYEIVIETGLFFRGIPGLRQRNTEGQQILRVKSRIDLAQSPQALNQ